MRKSEYIGETIYWFIFFVAVSSVPWSVPILAQSTRSFVHPGILNTQEELDQLRHTITTSPDHPMTVSYTRMKTWDGASYDYAHKPAAVVKVKAGGVVEQELRFRKDAQAAYACALQWVITGDDRFMRKSKEILNDWARTFLRMETVGGKPTVDQLIVEAGWVTPIWVAPAEIIRHYNRGAANWEPSEVAQFSRFLDRLWEEFGRLYYRLPPGREIQYRCNWGTSAALSMLAVAVFQENIARYQDAIAYWKEILPLNVELNGEIFETCRDCYHPGYALSTLVQAAEIAHHQGEDLYGTIVNDQPKPRLWYGLEYRARRIMGSENPEPRCFGNYQNYQSDCTSCEQCWYESGWEIGVNHYENRLNLSCSNARILLLKTRQREFDFDEHFVAFSTLTHGNK